MILTLIFFTFYLSTSLNDQRVVKIMGKMCDLNIMYYSSVVGHWSK